ncbi:MAG TPA: CopD family protein [Granulicella sp.]|jgi:putative copper resistance protein D|nr:CopD family protein [Granulicella sp.]
MNASLASGIESGISVLATALFDWSLALATGSLLAAHWLHPRPAAGEPCPRVPLLSTRPAAILMVLALCSQFYLLVATMTGQAAPADVLSAAPLVATTHAGRVALTTLGVALLLLLANLLKPLQTSPVPALLVALILTLHSATGHAAVEGDFSRAELLQLLHLSGMALWTGGVIVSGLFVVPRLLRGQLPSSAASRPPVDKAYLQALSIVSTYAVAVVLLTGAYKGWTGLDRHLSGLLHTGWGRILLLKLAFVAIALGLGALHRRWIHQHDRAWTPQQTKTLLTTLRVEAASLMLVIVLSAWLASVDPTES